MARGVFRNLGSFAGGGTKVLKLYTEGTQNVPWDNTTNTGTDDIGGFTFGTSYMSAVYPSGYSYRKVITQNKIDITPFDKIRIRYNNGQTVEYNISNISGEQYVIFDVTNSKYARIFLSPQKYAYTGYMVFHIDMLSTGSGTFYINEVVLITTDKKYLYKDGKQNVPWDNNGYILADNYTCDGGATLNEGNLTLIMPSTNNHNRTVVSNSVVDVSAYSTLKVGYAYNNAYHELSVNVSSIGVGGYVSINTHRSSTGAYIFDVVLSTSKSFPINNQLARTYLAIGNYNVTVSRVWLEK